MKYVEIPAGYRMLKQGETIIPGSDLIYIELIDKFLPIADTGQKYSHVTEFDLIIRKDDHAGN